MGTASRPDGSGSRSGDTRSQAARAREPQATRPLLARDVQVYRVSDILSGALILSLVVFAPWAFGTTQRWAIWTMNAGGYALGILLLIKLSIRHRKNYRPGLWTHRAPKEQNGAHSVPLSSAGITIVLAVLTVAVLAFCLLSAVNARQVYNPDAGFFEPLNRPAWLARWLPSSLDRSRSWLAFWNYLALAFFFWAVRNWLPGKTDAEQKLARPGQASARLDENSGPVSRHFFPGRLRRLLWVLSVNGGLVALESIVQRVSGSSKLLFLVQPQVNPLGETQFGPYAYRSNAAQYFNLIWPVCLGLWWMIQRGQGFKDRRAHLLLASSVLMASASLMSTSRGGVLITIGIFVAAILVFAAITFLFPRRHEDAQKSRAALRWITLCGMFALLVGLGVGWKSLKPRMTALGEGFTDREMMFDAARPMARDYPLFGTGPGTFERVFQLYRIQTSTYWPAQLHNDWLETRITFGWAGFSMVLLALLVAFAQWFVPGGIQGGRRFIVLLWLALAGCLIHARYDFPLQIYSVLFVFLTLCACMSMLSRRG